MMQMAFAGYGPDFTCEGDDRPESYTYTTTAMTGSTSDVSSGQPPGLILADPVTVALANWTKNTCSINGSTCSSFVYDGVKKTVVTEVNSHTGSAG